MVLGCLCKVAVEGMERGIGSNCGKEIAVFLMLDGTMDSVDLLEPK